MACASDDRICKIQANLEYLDKSFAEGDAFLARFRGEDAKSENVARMSLKLKAGTLEMLGNVPYPGRWTITQADIETFKSRFPDSKFVKVTLVEETPPPDEELPEEISEETDLTDDQLKAIAEGTTVTPPTTLTDEELKAIADAAHDAQMAAEAAAKTAEEAEKEALKAARAASKSAKKSARAEKRASQKSVKTIEERAMECASFTPIHAEVDGEETVIVSEGCRMRPSSAEFGAAGSVGIALDNIADEAFEHLGEAFVTLIENNIISIDVLMDALNSVPGATLVTSLISQIKECPKPPLIAPPLTDIFKTTELDFCSDNGISAEITLPTFRKLKIGPFLDIPGMVNQAVEDAVELLIFNMIKLAFKSVINIVINASCETIGDIGSLFGGSNLKDALKAAICGPSANDEEVDKGLHDILNALGAIGNVGEDCVGDFIEKVSNTITNEEAQQLMAGNPSPATLGYIMELLETECQCMAPLSEDNIARLFGGLGNVVDSSIMEPFLRTPPIRVPFNPDLCADSDSLEEFEKQRAMMLANRGLTPGQIDHQLAQAKQRKRQTVDDLNDLLAGLGEIKLPDLISDDPLCPEKGLMPHTDPSTAVGVSDAFGDMYDGINLIFLQDLVTRRGLLNMILSDVRGTGIKWHSEFFVRFFGDSLSSQLGYFEAFADGYDGDRKHKLIPVVGGDPILGIFPDTVAINLKNQLETLAPNFISVGDSIELFGERLKKKDLILHYGGWEEIDISETIFPGTKIQYYFDINYEHYQVDDTGTPKWGNEFKVSMNNLYDDDGNYGLVYSGTRNMSTGSQQYMESLYTTPSLLAEISETQQERDPSTQFPFTSEGDGIDNPKTEDATGLDAAGLDTEPVVEFPLLEKSPQATIFGQMVYNAWADILPDKAPAISGYCSTTLFNYIHSAILKKFATKISENARAFDFGFDVSLAPQIKILNGEGDYEKYGGSKKMPPFYIEPPKYGGWLGIYDALVPEVDACDRAPVVDFNDITSIVNKYNDKFKSDPRLEFNPLCVIEPPYSRILEKEAAAAIEGSIVALVRIYIVEVFLKGMPAFSLFEAKYPETYDEVLFGYISEMMMEDILELGGNVFLRPDIKKETFYYTFLEQVVQNFGRKIELNDITPTADEQKALDEINYIMQTYQEPTGYRKKIKKRREFEKYMSATAKYAKIILRRYISEGLEEISKTFKTALEPSIHDLSSLVFGSPNWMIGALTDNGPLNVPTSNMEGELFKYASALGYDLSAEVTHEDFLAGEGFFPFVLEKYIKIESYQSGECPDCPQTTNLGGEFPLSPIPLKDVTITNIEEWQNWLASNNSVLSKFKIKDGWKNWSFGLRISCIIPADFNQKLDILSSIDGLDALSHKSYNVGTPAGSDTSDTSESAYLIFPLIATEIPFDMEQTINSSLMDTYDTTCMVNQMIKTPEYETLFNYCFPLPSLLSLITIYTVEGFLPALGAEWEETNSPKTGANYTEAGGVVGGRGGSQFRRWDQETFKRTKKALRTMFRSNYHIRDINYKDPETDSPGKEARKRLKIKMKSPKIKINGKLMRMPWWMRKMLRPKPIDRCVVEEGN